MIPDLFKEYETVHHALVQQAVLWLLGPGGCVVASSEVNCRDNREIPDAIGWDGKGNCTIIECKATRADFLGDKNKPFRKKPELGMGRSRYYLTPLNLISAHDVPVKWGLIYITRPGKGRRIKRAN